MSINRVVITGNLGVDPELRRTQSGMAILSLRIAVNDRRKNSQTGEWEDYANWVDVTVFGNRAESLVNYLYKGSKVGIDGKLRWSQWEKDGQKRSKLEVVADDVELLTPKQSSQPQGGYQPQQQGYQPQQYQPAPQMAPQGAYQPQPTYQPQGGYQAQPQQYQQPAYQQPAIDASSSVYDDDIPF